MSGRVVVVTGSNTGIGRATATDLAARGATVVLACRSEAKTRPVVDEMIAATGNPNVEFLPLDLASLASVRESAATLLATDRPLHILVNNAGVAGQRGLTADGFELAFGINHLGHYLFTKLLLERMVRSAPARIVNVSSGNHFQPKGLDLDLVQRSTPSFVGLREYGVSKLCNVLFTQQLAERYEPDVVSAFAVNPGPVASDVWRRIPGPAYKIFQAIRRMKTNAEGAQPSLYCATTPGIESRSGSYLDEDCTWLAASAVATPELGRELWARSEAWVAAGG